MATDRRQFMQLLTGAGIAGALPASISKALAISANNTTGSIKDVEHIVILMQENRSFDHYFGTLRGVRGYGDPRAVTLPSGLSVFQQPDDTTTVLPFHPDKPDLGLTFIEDLAHDWTSTHAAWNDGNWDGWVPNKGTTTMAYLTRADIPYHYALADAFTICDAYHCSLMGPTDPNRYYMWTGYVGNDGTGGGPVIDNSEAGYGWSTFPERLVAAGITWNVYQDIGLGLTGAEYEGYTEDAYIGNYGDNSLLYFHQYQLAVPGSALANGAKRGTEVVVSGGLFDQLRQDVAGNALPQVSWIVAPEAYCEHPNWPANYGAYYVSQVIDALTSNPEVWSKTALFITFDENDGFFDHMVSPTVPPSSAQGRSTVAITNEIFPGNETYAKGPYGLGVRVPMIVVSPWTKGGFVCSQVFDHTSLIRFIETRFGQGLKEANISPWRRAICGDLTAAFDFVTPNAAAPTLPSTTGYVPPDDQRHPDYVPAVPADQSVPAQEPGVKPARPIPYEIDVAAEADFSAGTVRLDFINTGKAAAVFQVRSNSVAGGPWTFTVGAGHAVAHNWNIVGSYDLAVYGPNGFFRRFVGTIGGAANIAVRATYQPRTSTLIVYIANRGSKPALFTGNEAYTGRTASGLLQPGGTHRQEIALAKSYGWYDVTLTADIDAAFRLELAGHIENGEASISDPAIGG